MVGTRATKRAKPQREIKLEEEDVEEEERQNSTTPKRRCTEENALEKSEIKEEEEEEEEEDEEWSNEDEPSESDESIVGPDFDPEGRRFSDDSGDDLREKSRTDGDDLRKQRNANVNRDNGGEELSWGFRSAPDDQPDPLRFKPARTAGPALDATASWTPLSVFQLFCSAAVIRKIVENTNKKGARRKEAGIMKKWTPVTVKDLYMYFITVLYTGLVKLHDHKDYWRKAWPYRFPFPGDTMTRERFDEIRITLSLCDPEEDEENESKKGTPAYDKLFKIQPFYSELVDACKAHFQPHRNICVHERKAAKNRPLKCGYRLFALADSLTGYTWNLHIDTGKTAATRGQTAGYTAVKNLLPVSAIGSGFTLYTERLFSSPRLFTELLDKRVGCCGIISKHHSEFPQNAQKDFPNPPSRGDIRWLRKDKLLFVKWVDTREVAMCSTVHESFTGQVIKRPVKEGKGWVSKQFSCPDAVADFNRHMVVNNNFEFSFSMPCKRIKCWETVLFYHLLDLAVVNSFILYKEVMKVKGEPKNVSQKQFRENLCKEMFTFAKGCGPDAPSVAPAPAAEVLCLPVYYVPGNAHMGRLRCKYCKAKSAIYCQKCLITLCLTSGKNCFKEWHELAVSDED